MNKSSFDYYSADLDATEVLHKTRKQLAALHKQAIAGDVDAWQELWLYGTKLVLKICNKLRREDLLKLDFEDAVAEGNLAIGEALTRWNPKKSGFGTWVWIRIRGAVLDGNRAVSAVEQNEVSSNLEQEDHEGHVKAFDLGDVAGAATERDTGRELTAQRVRDAVRQLPSREMLVITRRYFDGLTQQEVGNQLGISRQMVDKVEKRAIENLTKGCIFRSISDNNTREMYY